jgi:hypothetical protein
MALTLSAGAASAANNDDLWEISTVRNMGSMKMPPEAVKSCLVHGASYVPKGVGKLECKLADKNQVGNKFTYSMKCGGGNYTANGESIRSATTLKGSLRMTARGMEMVDDYEGRLVGTCNAASDGKASASDADTRKYCADTVDGDVRSGGTTSGADNYKDGEQCAPEKASLCTKASARAITVEGWEQYRSAVEIGKADPSTEIGWVISMCHIDLQRILPGLCTRALAAKNYEFLVSDCPAEADKLRDQNCKGFGYDSSVDDNKPNAALCKALGRGKSTAAVTSGRKDGSGTAGNATAQPTPTPTPTPAKSATDAVMEQAKKLKGLLPF